jgi:hypothetical protein
VSVTDYAGKALKTRRFTEDDVLILPQSVSEIAQKSSLLDLEARKIRDIQSQCHVSDEIARTFLKKTRFEQ